MWVKGAEGVGAPVPDGGIGLARADRQTLGQEHTCVLNGIRPHDAVGTRAAV